MATIDDIRTGLRRSSGLAGSSVVLGLTFGALARAHGWGLGAPVVASLTIFSASAQFALLTVLAGGGAAWTAVASAALINLRFFPMALSAAPALHGGRIRRAVEAQTVVDGSWVLAHQGEGRFNRGVLFGSALAQWPAWVTGTILGVVLAPSIRLLNATGLDVVFPAFFALLLFDELRHSRSAGIAAAGAAVITALLLLGLPAGPALLGGAAAALLGLRHTKTEHS
jgi:predicted branched-subunit amino acid permease